MADPIASSRIEFVKTIQQFMPCVEVTSVNGCQAFQIQLNSECKQCHHWCQLIQPTYDRWHGIALTSSERRSESRLFKR